MHFLPLSDDYFSPTPRPNQCATLNTTTSVVATYRLYTQRRDVGEWGEIFLSSPFLPSLAPKFPLNDGRGREVASSSETILLDCVYIVNYLCARLFRARAKSRRICECLRDFFASLFRIIRIRSPFPSFCFLYLYHIIPSCIRSISFLNDSKFIF